MEWNQLGFGVSQGKELFWSLPIETGSTLWVRFPPGIPKETAIIGIGDAANSPPDKLENRLFVFENFAQIVKFEIPEPIVSPFMGIRFLDTFDSSYSPSFFAMTFLNFANPALPVLSQIPNSNNYALGYSFVFEGNKDTITLVQDPTDNSKVWIGEDRVERIEFDAEIVATPNNQAALNLSEAGQIVQVAWSGKTGGPRFFKRASIVFLSGYSSANIGVHSYHNTTGLATQFDNTLVPAIATKIEGLSAISSANYTDFWLFAVSDLEVKIGVEIVYAREYQQGETE